LEDIGIVDGKSRVLGVVLSSLKLRKRCQWELSYRLFQKAFPRDIAVFASNYPTNRMNLWLGGKQLVINSMRGDEIESGDHE
jgi:hypothetical protein